MPEMIAPRLLSWATELDDPTRAQAAQLARLHVLDGPVALMADAHLGKGATIGSVISTRRAIIPAAVGVDLGCGMEAVRTTLTAEDLPDNLQPLADRIHQAVPAGLGETAMHADPTPAALEWIRRRPDEAITPATELTDKQWQTAAVQLGTLGSGNHFLEVCLDEYHMVWVVLHSGSRGIGNQLATHHIKAAQRLADDYMIPLEHVDLAYFTTKMPEFRAYITDLRFAQAYAAENRRQMMDATLAQLFQVCGAGEAAEWISCHHNYTEREHHHDRDVWITRKGAIRARVGDRGILPGSMGASTYIVEGLGNPSAYHSSPHGAGRRMSRTQARKTITLETLVRQMQGRTWQHADAEALLDEAPDAYKPIDQVLAAHQGEVRPIHTLRAVLNYKGPDPGRPPRRVRREGPHGPSDKLTAAAFPLPADDQETLGS
jgi:tRNA-splicing ligase RtcB (3'-phosphate/5'-hydroxy nucleic acid ligase)